VVNHILGCEASQKEETRTTYLSQYQYTQPAVEKYLPADMTEINSPCDRNINLSKLQSPQSLEEKGEMEGIPYRQIYNRFY